MAEPATYRPTSPDELTALVAWAVGEEQKLEVVGNGSKRGLGRPVEAAHRLELSGLSGVAMYEPEELVMTAAAGTPLAQVEAELAECRQELAFEPADYGAILGGEPGRQTIGGVFACNLAGPRRIKAGAARDHLLGLHCVTGQGTAIKTGGRVVKNVTGYDLCKLLTGSYGTLAVLSEVTFKVLPRAETEGTLLLIGRSEPELLAALAQATGTSHDISGAACLPPLAAGRSSVPAVRRAGRAMAAVRVEGPGPSVDYRLERLEAELAGAGEMARLDERRQPRAVARDPRPAPPGRRAARCGGCRCRRRRRASWRAGPPSSRRSACGTGPAACSGWPRATPGPMRTGRSAPPSPAAAGTRRWSARTRSCAGRCRSSSPSRRRWQR